MSTQGSLQRAPVLFLGAASSNVPEPSRGEYQSYVKELVRILADFEVLGGVTTPAPIDRSKDLRSDDKRLYQWYRDQILSADLFLAEMTHPSFGLGIELEIAAEGNVPIIVTSVSHSANARISRMVLGLPGIAHIISYSSYQKALAGVPRDLAERLATLSS